MRRIGRVLMFAGLAVWIGGSTIVASHAWLNLPPQVLRALAMLLPFVVGGGLLVLGAMVVRAANREAQRQALAAERADVLEAAHEAVRDTAVRRDPVTTPRRQD